MPDARGRRRRKIAVRPWLRSIHRDVGYFVVGLTFIYALSGLAVNHIGQWDPNFTQVEQRHQVATPIAKDEPSAARHVLSELGVPEEPTEVYAVDDGQLDIVLEHRTLHVNTQTGVVLEDGQEPRVFLRLANWLHLNRGKKAWTYVADAYAVLLLYLASSGLFMLPGRKGLKGRGALIAIAGGLVPILYVTLAGGP
jgi:hypothetical protein